jgi:hypothetical protein
MSNTTIANGLCLIAERTVVNGNVLDSEMTRVED